MKNYFRLKASSISSTSLSEIICSGPMSLVAMMALALYSMTSRLSKALSRVAPETMTHCAERTGLRPGEPPDEPETECPICGKLCESLYLDIDNDVCGCENCLRKIDAADYDPDQ